MEAIDQPDFGHTKNLAFMYLVPPSPSRLSDHPLSLDHGWWSTDTDTAFS